MHNAQSTKYNVMGLNVRTLPTLSVYSLCIELVRYDKSTHSVCIHTMYGLIVSISTELLNVKKTCKTVNDWICWTTKTSENEYNFFERNGAIEFCIGTEISKSLSCVLVYYS